MDPEIFYAVVDGQLQRVATDRSLPASFLSAVPTNVSAILNTPAMTIGGWEDSTDGPLALALDADGEVTIIIAVNADQLDAMHETLRSIDTWLSTMSLRDLSELSGNHIVFYEGLWELSPNSSIALAPTRHYVMLTALDELPIADWSAVLPDARFSVRYFDAVAAPGYPALVRGRSADAELSMVPPPLAAVTEPAPIAAVTPLEIVTADDEPAERPHLEPVLDISVSDAPPAPVIDFSPVEIPRIDIVPPAPIPEDITPLEPVVAVEPAPVAGFSIAPEHANAEHANVEHADAEAADAVAAEAAAGVEADTGVERDDDVDIEADVVDLIAADAAMAIDLDDPLVNGFVDDLESALVHDSAALQPGMTYALNGLPLLFDATGESLISISDELFAVDDHIVLVVKLPERRRNSPFEERDRFRWDTALDRIQLLNDHSMNDRGQRRIVHLFVESDRQPEYAAYVGLLNRTEFQTQADAETAWFTIEPRLDADLHRQLKRGRLPQHQSQGANS